MDAGLIASLVKLIEVKDLTTAAHTWRVALYSRAMAEHAGLDHEFCERITKAAALHDLGKIDIPEHVLQKPGPLTPQEREVMQQHPALGHTRLLEMDETDPVLLELVRHHHEQPDGNGYPDRLTADQIPFVARVFSVIDSFDAMTSLRPYRRTVGENAAAAALVELHRHAGTRYDAEAVTLFTRVYSSGDLDWILHYFNDEFPVDSFCTDRARILKNPEIVVKPSDQPTLGSSRR